MRTVAHLSDLHFGRLDPATLPALKDALIAAKPDAVVVSGDLTQRARTAEFIAAKEFLDGLPFPKIVVPGNHDVPLYNIFARWLTPLKRFRQYIHADTEPFHADGEIAIVGVNTARSLTIKGGRINDEQMAQVCARFATAGPDVTRIVVTHHPFDLANTGGIGDVVGRAAEALAAFAACGVDVIVSGHMHAGRAGDSATRYPVGAKSILLVEGGTATSRRVRGEVNSWNLIRIARHDITVERWAWDGARRTFARAHSDQFQLASHGWSRQA